MASLALPVVKLRSDYGSVRIADFKELIARMQGEVPQVDMPQRRVYSQSSVVGSQSSILREHTNHYLAMVSDDKRRAASTSNDFDPIYTYDLNGNLTQKTNKSTSAFTLYEYDAENKLIRVVREDGSIVNYKYDGLGRRIEKEVDSVVTQYIYDNEDILLELDGSNNIVARYTHGPGIDEPLIMEKGGASFFYHPDGLGSITEITNQSGTVVRAYTYSSFGKVESQLDPNFIQPYTFTAREFDPETGLYYYRARYYDSFTGRFLQEDLIDLTGDNSHLFPYVGNNPTNWTDPLGLQPNGPPPVPVPGARPGNDWKFNPDSGNRRGGTWGPQKPIPNQSQPNASRDTEGHWDVNDGRGNRQRYDQQGKPISPEEAHRGRRLPPAPVPPSGGGLICPIPLFIPNVPAFQNYLDFLTGKGAPST